jgi:hypothetical protein
VEIPGPPTLPNDMRSIQLNVTSQPEDVYVTSPWRAPGTAPVYGSGCGAAGGGPTGFANGGQPPQGIPQGTDGVLLPTHGEAETWKRGSEVEVAWAISANRATPLRLSLPPTRLSAPMGSDVSTADAAAAMRAPQTVEGTRTASAHRATSPTSTSPASKPITWILRARCSGPRTRMAAASRCRCA